MNIAVSMPCLREQPRCHAHSPDRAAHIGVIEEASGVPYKTEQLQENPSNHPQFCDGGGDYCRRDGDLCTDNCYKDDKCFNMVWDPLNISQSVVEHSVAYGNCSYYAEGVLKAKICCDASVDLYSDYPDNCHFCCDKEVVYIGPPKKC